jgi:hypothetical protein
MDLDPASALIVSGSQDANKKEVFSKFSAYYVL